MSRPFGKKTVRDAAIEGRTVLLRVDFNVPLARRQVSDDTRVTAALPTIRHCVDRGAKVVLCSHLGRPGGRRVPSLSLKPVLPLLEAAVGPGVLWSPNAIGPGTRRIVAGLKQGQVALLENTRFYPEEERNEAVFARALASLGDIFVQDAFGAAHRAHASTVGVARVLPAVAGLLLEREVVTLGRLLEPERPSVAIVGGAKVAGKLGVLGSILPRVDRLLIGGGMANTFLAALGHSVGTSTVEAEQLPAAERLLAEARRLGVEVLLPLDLVVAAFFLPEADARIVQVGQVPDGHMALDIGPLTVERFAGALRGARTVFWNGPLGVAEWERFARGTAAVARAVAESEAFRVVGGGDSIAALRALGLDRRIDHLSTGGGASLEFLEGKELPGIACLEDA